MRKLKIANNPKISALLVYIDGIVKESDVSKIIIDKLSHRQDDKTYPADSYEILREAGVRTPRTAGQAISIVGALGLGQAAVDAGLVITPMVIVVATTAISSYAVPSVNMFFALTFSNLTTESPHNSL